MDAIARAEVKLSAQQTQQYDALAILLQKHPLKASESISKRIFYAIYIFLFLLLVGSIAVHSFVNHISVITEMKSVAVSLIAGLLVFFIQKLKDRERHKESQIKARRSSLEYSILFFDTRFSVSSASPEKYMNRDYPYDRYVNAVEWQDAFFLHAGNMKEFIIPKSCIIEGTAEGLARHLYDKLGDRFRVEANR